MNDVMVSSRVRLARNYDEYPFPEKMSREDAEKCVQRTLNALRELPDSFTYMPLQSAGQLEKELLLEENMITAELLQHESYAAALIRQTHNASVLIHEKDHIRIVSMGSGDDLRSVAGYAFFLDELLQRKKPFAFDEQFGYLTASPAMAGTGFSASILLHLPILKRQQRIEKAQQVAKQSSLQFHSAFATEDESSLYMLESKDVRGITEQQEIGALVTAGRQIAGMEHIAREKVRVQEEWQLEDEIFRGYGLLQNARLMSYDEFMKNYSFLRLGVVLQLINCSLEKVDELPVLCKKAHLQRFTEKELSTVQEESYARCSFLRDWFQKGG